MKTIKTSLRLWVAIGSTISFLGGWALFSHAGKPAPLIQAAPADSSTVTSQVVIPTLAPIPSIQDMISTDLQPIPSLPATTSKAPSQSFFPRLRTRGS